MADEKDDEIERLRSMFARVKEKREDSRIKRIITGLRTGTKNELEDMPEKRKGAA
ncbi:MAG: hypothetical protein ACLPOO_01795 [Terriglobales bacterium]|jgi:hypothetical protein